MAHVVFDVGGTTTRAALFDNGKLLRIARAPTPNHLARQDANFDGLRQALLTLMDDLARDVAGVSPQRVSVAFAGPVGPRGEVLAAPTIWGTRLGAPYDLHGDLATLWPRARITVLNDVTAAGYRYARPGDDTFCIVTVSSGIGNKVFVGGRPVLGPRGAGGELGHFVVDDSRDAPQCECGGRGHLGAIASGRGVLAYARRAVAHLTSGDLVAAFHRGESVAQEAVHRGADALGRALASVHLALGLERFVIFGGFGLALGEPFRALVAQAAAQRCWSGAWTARVELGADDDFSGLIGAGLAGCT